MAVQNFPASQSNVPPYATQLVVGGNFLTGNYTKTASLGAATYVLHNPGGQNMTFNFPNNNVEYTATSGQTQYFKLATTESQIIIYSPGGAPSTANKVLTTGVLLGSNGGEFPKVSAVGNDGTYTYFGGPRGQIARTADFISYQNLNNLNYNGYVNENSDSTYSQSRTIYGFASVVTHPTIKALGTSIYSNSGFATYLWYSTDGLTFGGNYLNGCVTPDPTQYHSRGKIQYINNYFVIKQSPHWNYGSSYSTGGRYYVLGTNGSGYYTDGPSNSWNDTMNSLQYWNGKWYSASDYGLFYTSGPNISSTNTWTQLYPFGTSATHMKGVADIVYTGTYYIAMGSKRWTTYVNHPQFGTPNSTTSTLYYMPPSVSVSTDGLNFTQVNGSPFKWNVNQYGGTPLNYNTSTPNQLSWVTGANKWMFWNSIFTQSGYGPVMSFTGYDRSEPYYSSVPNISSYTITNMMSNAAGTTYVAAANGVASVWVSTNASTISGYTVANWNQVSHSGLTGIRQGIHDGTYFIMVGGTGATSSADGFTWSTNTYSVAPSSILSLTYGPSVATNKYIAVGSGGQIYYKTTGNGNWTILATGSTVWHDVAFLNTRYVAIGNIAGSSTGYVGWSTDGASWSTSPNSMLASMGKIVFKNGYYSAFPTYASYNNGTPSIPSYHVVSTDLINWTSRATDNPSGNYYLSVGVSPTQIIALRSDQSEFVSTDGLNFNTKPLSSLSGNVDALEAWTTGGVAYFTDNSSVYATTNGVTWATSPIATYFPASPNTAIPYYNGRNWYQGTDSAGGGFYMSTNSGSTWMGGNNNLVYPSGVDGFQYTGIPVSNDNNIAYLPFWKSNSGTSPQNMYLSTDAGTTWNITQQNVNLPYPSDSAANGDTMVIVGQNNIIVSTNAGVSWYAATSPNGLNYVWSGVSYGNGLFMAVTDNAVRISSNGIYWTSAAGWGGSYTIPMGIGYGNGAWSVPVYTSNGTGYLFTSQDNATTWTQRTPTVTSTNYAPRTLMDAAYGNSRWTTFDSTGRVYMSTNVTNWAIVATLPSGAFYEGNVNTLYIYGPSSTSLDYNTHPYRISFMQGYFALSGIVSTNSFYTSTDATNWTARSYTIPVSQEQTGLTFAYTSPRAYPTFSKFKNKIILSGRGNSVYMATSVGSGGVAALFKTNLIDIV